MEDIYNYILDNIYIFCLLLILIFVLIIFIMYVIKCSKGEDKKEEKVKVDPTLKSKAELEKISDDEIEKRVIEEYKEETRELDEKLNKLKENYKDNSSVEDIIDTLKEAKEKTTSDTLKKFEDEQEEQAIISYKQLVETVRGTNSDTNDTVKEEKEADTTKTLMEKYDNLNKEIDEEPIVEKIDYSYKPNEFISPVFGRMDSSHVKYREGLSYTDKAKKEEYNEEDFNEDFKHVEKFYKEDSDKLVRTPRLDSEEFLKNLKEFRNNL